MSWSFSFLLLFLLHAAVVVSEIDASNPQSLRVKQLKQILQGRGVDCQGCIEKKEFVQRVIETENFIQESLKGPEGEYCVEKVRRDRVFTIT